MAMTNDEATACQNLARFLLGLPKEDGDRVTPTGAELALQKVIAASHARFGGGVRPDQVDGRRVAAVTWERERPDEFEGPWELHPFDACRWDDCRLHRRAGSPTSQREPT